MNPPEVPRGSEHPRFPDHKESGDLSVTALYTAQAWRWAGFEHAHLLATRQSRDVFNATNLVLGLARLFRPSLPSLRHSLAQRHAMFDRLCADWVNATPGRRQVLELGAGLSRRGISFSADVDTDYIEIDLPAVIARKQVLLGRTPSGRAVLERANYRRVAGDVTAGGVAELAPGPVLILAEGLFMYFAAEAQREVWGRLAQLVRERPGSAFVFDFVPICEQPRPGFVGRTLERLFKAFTRGRTTTQDARTRQDIAGELAAAGFERVDLLEPAHVASQWQLPFPGKQTQVLLFRCT